MSRTRVKICGLTRTDDLLAAEAAGADAIGLVFWPHSKRYLEPAQAADLAAAAGPYTTLVGLFVDAEPATVRAVLDQVPLHSLQFHGDEDDTYCAQFGRPFVKTLRVRDDLDLATAMARYPRAAGILLDTYRPGVPGGTGEVFDWARVPSQRPRPLIVAGGLNAANVAGAVAQVQPYAVDVSGGVEAAPGCKDAAKMAAFIAAVRGE